MVAYNSRISWATYTSKSYANSGWRTKPPRPIGWNKQWCVELNILRLRYSSTHLANTVGADANSCDPITEEDVLETNRFQWYGLCTSVHYCPLLRFIFPDYSFFFLFFPICVSFSPSFSFFFPFFVSFALSFASSIQHTAERKRKYSARTRQEIGEPSQIDRVAKIHTMGEMCRRNHLTTRNKKSARHQRN